MDPFQLIAAQSSAQDSSPGAAQGERGVPRNASVRWLRELERAQWTLRGNQAAPAASRTRFPGEAPAPGALRSGAMPPPAEGSAPSGGRDEPARPLPAAPRPAAQPPTSGGVASRDVTGTGAGHAAHAERPGSVRSGVRSLAAEPPPRAAAAWPRVNVHAYRSEDAIHVWIRDASLDEGARRKLAEELRDGLRRSGERLGALVVNGTAILPAAPAADDDGHST